MGYCDVRRSKIAESFFCVIESFLSFCICELVGVSDVFLYLLHC